MRKGGECQDENTIRVLRDHSEMELPEVGAMILVETDGYTKEEAAYQMERVIEAFRRNGALDLQAADSEEEAEALWRVRKSVSGVSAA